jgi:hypothetical protein
MQSTAAMRASAPKAAERPALRHTAERCNERAENLCLPEIWRFFGIVLPTPRRPWSVSTCVMARGVERAGSPGKTRRAQGSTVSVMPRGALPRQCSGVRWADRPRPASRDGQNETLRPISLCSPPATLEEVVMKVQQSELLEPTNPVAIAGDNHDG